MVTSRPLTVAPWWASAATVADEQPAFLDLDALVQALGVVARFDGHGGLGEHRAGVDAVVDEVHGGAGDLHAVGQRVGRGLRAGEGGQQARGGC